MTSYRVQRAALDQLTSAQRERWQSLQREPAFPSAAFLSLAYCEAVHRQLAPVTVVMLHDGTDWVGFLPLQRYAKWPGAFGVHEPVGGVMTDYFGWIAAPHVKMDLPRVLQQAGVPCLYFTHLDETQKSLGMPGDTPLLGLRTVIEGDPATFWQSLRTKDKKLVSDTERRSAKLIKEHGATMFEAVSSQPAADLDTLIQLKKAQYTRTGVRKAPLFDAANVALLQQLLQTQDPLCKGVLSVLKIDGRMIAAHFGIQCGDVLHYWFPVYDEAFSSYSPGRILYRHVIEASAGLGIRVIDRGVGDSPAKRDFGNQEHLYFKGLAHGGWRGAWAKFMMSLHWRLKF